MIEYFNKVKELINGEEHDAFMELGFGKYVNGSMTFTMGADSYTMFFYEGNIIDVKEGQPLTGLDFGIGGPIEGWKELFSHRNFSMAIAPKHGKLRHQGNLVRCMSNLNSMAYVCRVLCTVISEE